MMRWLLPLLFVLFAATAQAQITCPAPVGPGRVVGDANMSLSNSFSYYETGAQITAPRTWTLPPASTVNKYCMIVFSDQFGGITPQNPITIQGGTAQSGVQDTIAGSSSVQLNSRYAVLFLQSDGSSKWAIANGTNNLLNIRPLNAVTVFGADPTGNNDSSAAIRAMFAQAGPSVVYFPQGTYRVTCGHNFVANGAVSLLGAGRGLSIIKQDAGCTPTTDFMSWTNFGAVAIQNLSIDLNTPATVAVSTSGVAFYVTGSNNLVGPQFLNSEVLNFGSSSGGAYAFRLSVLNSAASWTHPIISQSRFTKTTADANTANEAFAFGGNGGFDSLALGNIHGAMAVNNVLVNSGIQADGDHGYWGGNDITGWAFGNGIFTQADIPFPGGLGSDHDNVFEGNIIHDSPLGYDVNSSAGSCVENNGYRNLWVGNILHDCGGEGFRNYGTYTGIIGNTIYNNGKTTSIVGNYQQAGINLVLSGAGAPFNSASITIHDNKIYDTAGTQLYGIADASGIAGPIDILGNDASAPTPANTYHQASAQGTWTGDPWQETFLSQIAGLSCFSGALTTGAANVYYQKLPLKLSFLFSAFIVTNGTCVGFLKGAMPFASAPGASSFDFPSNGLSATTGNALTGLVSHSDTTDITIKRYDNVWPGTDNTAYTVMGNYATAN